MRTHAREMFAALSDPAIYLYTDEAPPVSVAALAERYAKLESRHSRDGSELWLNWVVREASSHEVAGFVQATVMANRSAYVAFVIAPSQQRKGYAREATDVMIRELRETYGAKSLLANVDRRNVASIALVKSLGFEEIPGADRPGDQLYEA
ncbi:hypothetical protein BWI17_07085 [Betaproteobacteria bacterium GR16-43]|nr:hypothetical protein BWI17_07085 [Betaproteobacteria bacterium GR16-43]